MAEEKDLVIGEEEVEYKADDYTPLTEIVAAAVNAIGAVEGLNPMTKERKEQASNIMAKSLALLDWAIGELHAEVFGSEESEE